MGVQGNSKFKCLCLFLYVRFLRKVWYLGWKPTVSHTLVGIIHSLNNIIKGLPSEILTSITLLEFTSLWNWGNNLLLFLDAVYRGYCIKASHINVSSLSCYCLTIAQYGYLTPSSRGYFEVGSRSLFLLLRSCVMYCT